MACFRSCEFDTFRGNLIPFVSRVGRYIAESPLALCQAQCMFTTWTNRQPKERLAGRVTEMFNIVLMAHIPEKAGAVSVTAN